MRFSELTDQQRAALMQQFVQRPLEAVPDLRRSRRFIAACFVAAGFCIFGCINTLRFAPALSSAAMMFIFAVGTAYFLGTAWKKWTAHMMLMSAAERAYLLLVFEHCADRGIEFSTGEVVDFLRFAPDRPANGLRTDSAQEV
jgi:hypothetical protein